MPKNNNDHNFMVDSKCEHLCLKRSNKPAKNKVNGFMIACLLFKQLGIILNIIEMNALLHRNDNQY